MKKTLFLIVGESGAGKTAICSELEAHFGYKGVKSYTSRPRRTPDEDGHTFVTKEEIDRFTLIAPTENGGYKYGATENQVAESDFYVIDVAGIEYFKNQYHGDKQIKVIYIQVPEFAREKRMKARGDAEQNIQYRKQHDREHFANVLRMSDKVVKNEDFYECVAEIHEYIDSFNTVAGSSVYADDLVLFDMDNVLENLTDCWRRSLNARHHMYVAMSDITDYSFHKFYPNLSQEAFVAPLNDDLFYLMEPIQGMVELLQSLINKGVPFRIATASHYKGLEAKMSFFEQYMPFVKWSQMIIAKNKQGIRGDVLVDDFYDNLVGGEYRGIIVTYPWNEKLSDSELAANGIIRSHNAQEIEKAIFKILDEKHAAKEAKKGE